MASNKNIKGITIEINATTTKLENALKSVTNDLNKTQKELNEVNKMLKFDPKNTELLAQKQTLLQKELSTSKERLKELLKAQEQVEEQFRRGEIGEEQYRSFKREVESAKKKVDDCKKSLENFNKVKINNLNSEIKKCKDELKDLDEALKIDPKNITLLAQKQQVLQEAIRKSREKVDELKQAYAEAQAKVERGDMGVEEFRKLEREVINAKQELNKLETELGQTEQDIKDVGNADKFINKVKEKFKELRDQQDEVGDSADGLIGKFKDMAKAVAGISFGKKVLDFGLDATENKAKINILFDLPEESKAKIREAQNSLEAMGMEGEEALQSLKKQFSLNADATDEYNIAIVENAQALAGAYSGIDVTELIQETNELSTALEITDQEAIAMTASLMKAGFPPEQIDILSEYGRQMSNMGYDAEQIQAIFSKGISVENWNIESLYDGIKEGNIQLKEFGAGVDETFADLLNQAGIGAEHFQELSQAIAGGGKTGADAMTQLAEEIKGIEDPVLKNQIAVKVWGTMFEDSGEGVIDTLLGVNGELKTSADNQAEMNRIMGETETPAKKLNEAFGKLKIALEPAVEKVADFVGKLADYINENPEVIDQIAKVVVEVVKFVAGFKVATTTIKTTTKVIGGISKAIKTLKKVFDVIKTVAGGATKIIGVLQKGFGALKTAFGVVKGVIAGISAPVAVAIGLVTTAVGLWVKNWEGIKSGLTAIKEYFLEFVGWIGEKLGSLKEWFSETWDIISNNISTAWENIKNFFSETWNSITETVSIVWNGICNFFSETWNWISETASSIFNGIVEFFSGIWDSITGTISSVWDGICNFFSETWNTISEGVSNVWNGIWNFLDETMSSIWETITGIWDDIVEGVGGALDGIWEGVTGAWDDVIKYLEEIDLFEIGKNIIQGMVDGVCSMAESLWKGVKDTINGAIDAGKDLLGINSPSKVFAEIGQYTGEGFIVGMEDMQKEVSKAGQKMANASIPDLPKTNRLAGAVSEAQGTVLYATNITYLDNKEIARETTKQVISNIDRTQNSKMKGRGY